MHVAVATYRAKPDLPADERLLIPALAPHGIAASPAVWDDPAIAWAGFDAVVVRSCWDYHLRVQAFLDWLTRLDRLGVPVLNPTALIRWNADKRYLLEIARRNIAVVPTRIVPRGSDAALADVLEALGAAEAVVKPAVSASAHATWRTSRARAEADAVRFRALVAAGDVLVQPFLDTVARDGEWSLVCFGGTPSHAVLKRPAAAPRSTRGWTGAWSTAASCSWSSS